MSDLTDYDPSESQVGHTLLRTPRPGGIVRVLLIFAVLSIVLVTMVMSGLEGRAPRRLSRTPTPVLRNVHWGMTRDQVKKTEASTPLLADHEMYLAYSARLYRFDMVLVYVFDKPDLLTSAHCLFDIRFDATDKHLRDFRSIKGALTRAYGPPSRDEEIWADTEYTIGGISKDTPDQYGRAVLYGYLTYEAEWLTRDSAIGLRLFGEQLRVATIVSLASRQWLEARGMTVFGLKQPR